LANDGAVTVLDGANSTSKAPTIGRNLRERRIGMFFCPPAGRSLAIAARIAAMSVSSAPSVEAA
jgi:hypothetical protein